MRRGHRRARPTALQTGKRRCTPGAPRTYLQDLEAAQRGVDLRGGAVGRRGAGARLWRAGGESAPLRTTRPPRSSPAAAHLQPTCSPPAAPPAHLQPVRLHQILSLADLFAGERWGICGPRALRAPDHSAAVRWSSPTPPHRNNLTSPHPTRPPHPHLILVHVHVQGGLRAGSGMSRGIQAGIHAWGQQQQRRRVSPGAATPGRRRPRPPRRTGSCQRGCRRRRWRQWGCRRRRPPPCTWRQHAQHSTSWAQLRQHAGKWKCRPPGRVSHYPHLDRHMPAICKSSSSSSSRISYKAAPRAVVPCKVCAQLASPCPPCTRHEKRCQIGPTLRRTLILPTRATALSSLFWMSY